MRRAYANANPTYPNGYSTALPGTYLAQNIALGNAANLGIEHGDWVRLSLATRREDVAEAAARLRQHVTAAAR